MVICHLKINITYLSINSLCNKSALCQYLWWTNFSWDTNQQLTDNSKTIT